MITKLSFILVIISGIIHPLWNLILKKSDEKVAFYLNMHLVYTALFGFILLFYPLKEITLLGWAFVVLSAFMHFLYQIYLCRTYYLGDMSLTYPIIRSAPIFVLFGGIIFLREMPSLWAVAGIITVIFGVNVINQKTLSFAAMLAPFRHMNKAATIAALLTAFFSACYSVVDKKGVLAMDPILFFYLFFTLSGFFFLVYFAFLKEKRGRYMQVLKKDIFKITLAAVLEFSSYILILYAFRVSKIAYIVALRQISVVFGALYGILFLKEKHADVRFVGSVIIFIGIFLITVFG